MLISNIADRSGIEQIHDGSFQLPDINSPLLVSKKLIVDNGELVGAAFTRITAEGILVMNKSLPTITRAKEAEQLIITLRDDAKRVGLEDCHVFVKDPKVQRFLKHMGFQDCQGGQPMVIFL